MEAQRDHTLASICINRYCLLLLLASVACIDQVAGSGFMVLSGCESCLGSVVSVASLPMPQPSPSPAPDLSVDVMPEPEGMIDTGESNFPLSYCSSKPFDVHMEVPPSAGNIDL